MERKTSLAGIPNTAWLVIAILIAAGGAMWLCALMLLFFGLDIGIAVG